VSQTAQGRGCSCRGGAVSCKASLCRVNSRAQVGA
jgi:hypothetical protein